VPVIPNLPVISNLPVIPSAARDLHFTLVEHDGTALLTRMAAD
jgi:hypothetical protein